jgi:hypothetical protein
MIDGLKVRMTSAELAVRLSERIEWHQRAAAECEAEWRRPGTGREDTLVPEPMLEHEMREHREQAGVLQMLRDHLVPDEVYQLSEMDLRFADLVPDFHVEYSLPSPSADAGGSDHRPILEV